MKNKKNRGADLPIALAFGWLCSAIVTLCGALVVAALVLGEKMEQTDVIYGVTAVLLLSGFLGSWTGAGIAENKKMLASLLAGTCYYLTLLCITAVIFEGRYQNIWITAALILGSSCGAGFVRMRKRKSGYTSKIRRVKI